MRESKFEHLKFLAGSLCHPWRSRKSLRAHNERSERRERSETIRFNVTLRMRRTSFGPYGALGKWLTRLQCGWFLLLNRISWETWNKSQGFDWIDLIEDDGARGQRLQGQVGRTGRKIRRWVANGHHKFDILWLNHIDAIESTLIELIYSLHYEFNDHQWHWASSFMVLGMGGIRGVSKLMGLLESLEMFIKRHLVYY